MVVGPEFGPIAGLLRGDRPAAARPRAALRSPRWPSASRPRSRRPSLFTLLFKWTGIDSDGLRRRRHPLTEFISNPDFFSFFVAYLAGTAGVLSLTSAKSGALIGVLISVTTIPAAANIGVATAYTDWGRSEERPRSSGSTSLRSSWEDWLGWPCNAAVYDVRLKRHLSDSAPEP